MFKKIFILILMLIISGPVFAEEDYPPPKDGSGTIGNSRNDSAWDRMISEKFEISEKDAVSTAPSGHWNLEATSAGVFITDDLGASTQITAGSGDNTLDNAYDQGGSGAGRSITADTGAVAISNTDVDNAFLFTLNASPSGAAASGGAQITVGGNSTQDALEFVNSGSGYDIYGTSGTWTISKAGAIVGVSADLSGSFAADGNITLGDGTGTLAINTSSWDISTAGAMTGIASLALTGDITLANGKAIQSSTTTAETMLLKGYDVDNTTYRNTFSLTNGDTIAAALGTGLETLAINTTTWDVSTTGAFTGIADITGTAGEAFGITLASNGAADDLTISVTGANDSSVILASAGTGEDAIAAQSSAGGVDIDAAAAKDVNIAGGQVALVSKDNAASAIALTANIGTTETIVVTNTQGTSESAITLVSTAGGVNVDAAAAKDLDLAGGQVNLVSKDNAASAIALTANIGTSETIVVTNTQGTSESAITLVSTAGGVNVDAAAAKDLDLAGGQVKLVSKDNAAGAISLTANIGTSETITVTNTQGTSAGAINLTATAGGITLSSSAGVATSDPITGDGTAALGGFLKTVLNDTDAHSVLVTESGTVLTNAGSGGAAAFTLPSAAIGLEYTFVVMAAQELRVTPAAGDSIIIAGVAGDSAEYWTANAVGASVTLVAVDVNNWIAKSSLGTWTQQTP
jgi:hypothetical protein